MKKKLISILLSITLTASLIVGCADNAKDEVSKTTNDDEAIDNAESETVSNNEVTETEPDDSQKELEAIGDLEVDKGIFDVKITIPADLLAGTSKEDIEKEAEKSGIHEVIFNDDGSATYVMDKPTHKEMLNGLKSGIDEMIDGLIEGEDSVASFKEIIYNDDVTEFTVKCDSSQYSDMDSFSSMALFFSSAMYQIFEGKSEDARYVIVDFVDMETGETIEKMDSREME